MTFDRPPAADDPEWPRASTWLHDAPSAQLHVVGIPSSSGSISQSNADQAPAAIRDALRRLSPFDAHGNRDLLEGTAHDHGDLDVAALDCRSMTAAAHEQLRIMREAAPDAAWLLLGGDNAITRPGVTGLIGDDLSSIGVITLDAHHDVRHLDDGPRNGNPIKGLIVEHHLPGLNVVQIGIGAFTNARLHREWCLAKGVSLIDAETVHAQGAAAAARTALDALSHCEALYLDVDMDVLDRAYAPACPGSRPGGLTPQQLDGLVRTLCASPRMKAVDFTEVDPAADVAGTTVLNTAQAVLAAASALTSR